MFKGIVSRYKAYLLLNELINLKIQLKWVQEVWAHRVSWYSAQEYAEDERVQRKDFVDDRVEMLAIFSYGQPKGMNTDKYRKLWLLSTPRY